MCGRFTLKTPAGELARYFQLAAAGERQLELFGPRYNVAPTQAIPVIRSGADERSVDLMRWGLWPAWSKGPPTGAPLINARSETIGEKPSFRTAIRQRRCLLMADGFYEWQETGGRRKQPFYIRRRDEAPFAFAGIWETWRPAEGEPLLSCALVNKAAAGWMTEIHHRMPIVLSRDECDRWLDPNITEPAELADLFTPQPHDELRATPVGDYVNKATQEGPRCLEAPRTLF